MDPLTISESTLQIIPCELVRRFTILPQSADTGSVTLYGEEKAGTRIVVVSQ